MTLLMTNIPALGKVKEAGRPMMIGATAGLRGRRDNRMPLFMDWHNVSCEKPSPAAQAADLRLEDWALATEKPTERL
jgi:hypothetical protein